MGLSARSPAVPNIQPRFEAVHAELAPKFKGRLKATPADYQARGAIYLPDIARFSRLLARPYYEHRLAA